MVKPDRGRWRTQTLKQYLNVERIETCYFSENRHQAGIESTRQTAAIAKLHVPLWWCKLEVLSHGGSPQSIYAGKKHCAFLKPECHSGERSRASSWQTPRSNQQTYKSRGVNKRALAWQRLMTRGPPAVPRMSQEVTLLVCSCETKSHKYLPCARCLSSDWHLPDNVRVPNRHDKLAQCWLIVGHAGPLLSQYWDSVWWLLVYDVRVRWHTRRLFTWPAYL